MKILQETTVWDTAVPNHIYYVTDSKDKMLAYIKASNNEPVVLSKPIKFDTRHRTFKELKAI
jgi:hypothetical protein